MFDLGRIVFGSGVVIVKEPYKGFLALREQSVQFELGGNVGDLATTIVLSRPNNQGSSHSWKSSLSEESSSLNLSLLA